MARPFDLKKQLKLHDRTLLRRLFAEHDVLPDLPWDDVRPHDVEPIVARWPAVPDDRRRHLEVVLQDVNELADERCQRVLVQDLDDRRPDARAAFRAWPGRHDRALWAYLDAREVFDGAATFARAEALRGGQFANRWNSLPKVPLDVTPDRRAALERGIRDFYREKELRDDRCCVHHARRANGADYFYAYIPEWADKRLGFDAAGELQAYEQKYAFHNVFVFDAADGSLEIVARGGKKVHLPLRRAFCAAVLGLAVADTDPVRRGYDLDHLLDPAFAFTTEPADGIAAVRLRRLRILPLVERPALDDAELRLKEVASLAEVRAAAARFRAAFDLERSQVTVAEAGIQIEFRGGGRGRPRTMTFNVSTPTTCDLKSKPDDVRVVGERCIRRWGIVRD